MIPHFRFAKSRNKTGKTYLFHSSRYFAKIKYYTIKVYILSVCFEIDFWMG